MTMNWLEKDKKNYPTHLKEFLFIKSNVYLCHIFFMNIWVDICLYANHTLFGKL